MSPKLEATILAGAAHIAVLGAMLCALQTESIVLTLAAMIAAKYDVYVILPALKAMK